MKFFPTIKYVKEIPREEVPFTVTLALLRGADIRGVCVFYAENLSIQIYVIRGEHSKFVLFHELCHWLVYRITKSNSYLQNKLHDWIDKYVRPSENKK